MWWRQFRYIWKETFGVRLSNAMAMRHRNVSLSKCCSVNENEKKKAIYWKGFSSRTWLIHPTHLAVSSKGDFGRECARFYSKLVEKIAEKWHQPYSMLWIKRKIIFSLLKSVRLCLRGSISIWNQVSIKNDPTVSERLSKMIQYYKKKLQMIKEHLYYIYIYIYIYMYIYIYTYMYIYVLYVYFIYIYI